MKPARCCAEMPCHAEMPSARGYLCWACAGDGLQSIEAAEASGLAHERDASIALLHSDADRREFISAGAAAGLAVRTRCLPARRFLPFTIMLTCRAAMKQASVWHLSINHQAGVSCPPTQTRAWGSKRR